MTSSSSFRQRVPRPPAAKRVEAPVASFPRLGPESARRAFSLEALERVFSDRETGAPVTAPRPTGPGPHREAATEPLAAVLVAVGWGGAGEEKLLLTRRSPALRANPGEIAFPGGRIDSGESSAQAALREAYEEVALPPSSVRVLGRLPLAGRARRRGEIVPVVASVEGAPGLVANPSEVEEIFLVSLSELADPARYWEERWVRDDGEAWQMPFFERGEDLIWGASAAILVELLDLLAKYSGGAVESDRSERFG